MKKILSFIMPIFGKDPKLIEENIKLISEKIILNNFDANEVEFILIYKNSKNNELNYDFLNKYTNEYIKVFKVEQNRKRTHKVKVGIENSNSKYSIIIDSHHTVNFNNLKSTLNKLIEINSDIIWMKIIWNNVADSGDYKSHGNRKTFTAGNHILKTDILKEKYKICNFDIIFGDDLTPGLLTVMGEERKEFFINKSIYIRNYDINTSSTHFWSKKNNEDRSKILDDFIKIFMFFYKKNCELESKNYAFYKTMYNLSKVIFRIKISLMPGENSINDPFSIKKAADEMFGEKSIYILLAINKFRGKAYKPWSHLRYWLLSDRDINLIQK